MVLLVRKLVLFFIIGLLFVPTAVGARDLFDAGLSVSGVYDTRGATDSEDFFQGMGNGDNWTIGVGVHARLSIVNLSILAILPNGASGGYVEILALRPSLTFDIPLVTDRLYLHLGGGLSTDFSYEEGLEGGTDTHINGLPLESISFGDAVMSSRIHAKIGLDVLIGTAKLGIFYMHETAASLESLSDGSGWAQLEQTRPDSKIGVMLQLALF